MTEELKAGHRELADHTSAERTMKDLERCAADDPEFDRLITQLMAEVRHHVRDEESNLFPQLAKACSASVLDVLGDKVRRAKKPAPTRPHSGPRPSRRPTGSSRRASASSTGCATR